MDQQQCRRGSGLLVGVASLTDGIASREASSSSSSSSSNRGTRSVYLSGFRIVQEVDKCRHCEYRVVLVNAHYERWTRFSTIKRFASELLLSGSMTEGSQAAWDAVRRCKSPRGKALDTAHLGRKCLAIENFLTSLLEDVELDPMYVAELLTVPTPRSRVVASTGRICKQQHWVPGMPSHISRGRAGLRISTR
ncbi:unnamed protein product [Ectocarpus sp. 6 AP-2014]